MPKAINPIPQHLKEKREEIIFALADKSQGYTPADIQKMFNFSHASAVTRILEKRPINYKPKWIKAK